MNPIKKAIKPFVTSPAVAKTLCRWLFLLENLVDKSVNELLPYTEGGVHPKHRLMNYHQFFVDHIAAEDRVLDVGCGYGAVANSVAKKAHRVVGIDLNPKNVDFAKSHYRHPNLSFVLGDALRDIPAGEFDVIVLSNVLEHIESRPEFLRRLMQKAPRILIRVPMITRDWKPLYKREIDIDYRLDDTHFTEYTEAQFRQELQEAALKIVSLTVSFGEIWAVAASPVESPKKEPSAVR